MEVDSRSTNCRNMLKITIRIAVFNSALETVFVLIPKNSVQSMKLVQYNTIVPTKTEMLNKKPYAEDIKHLIVF